MRGLGDDDDDEEEEVGSVCKLALLVRLTSSATCALSPALLAAAVRGVSLLASAAEDPESSSSHRSK